METRVESRLLGVADTSPETLQAVLEGDGGGFADGLQIAADPYGNALFAWRESGAHAVQVRALAANALLTPVKALSPFGDDTSIPFVSVDEGLNGIVVWASRVPAGDIAFRTISFE